MQPSPFPSAGSLQHCKNPRLLTHCEVGTLHQGVRPTGWGMWELNSSPLLSNLCVSARRYSCLRRGHLWLHPKALCPCQVLHPLFTNEHRSTLESRVAQHTTRGHVAILIAGSHAALCNMKGALLGPLVFPPSIT